MTSYYFPIVSEQLHAPRLHTHFNQLVTIARVPVSKYWEHNKNSYIGQKSVASDNHLLTMYNNSKFKGN